MILYLTGDLFENLNPRGALLVTYGSLKDALDAFNLLWMLLWSLCLLPN